MNSYNPNDDLVEDLTRDDSEDEQSFRESIYRSQKDNLDRISKDEYLDY